MTTRLRLVLDQLRAPVPGGIGRYTAELARALLATAPSTWEVEGVISASSAEEIDGLRQAIPTLDHIITSRLSRRELALAWQYGLVVDRRTTHLHSPSLLAPLGEPTRSSSAANPAVVTIHDVVPWSHPETLSAHGVRWHRAMARRAERFADAIVVPTHAVANQLRDVLALGDRVQVIGGAASSTLTLPVDSDRRATALGLPDRYILSVGTLEPRKGIPDLIAAFGRLARPGVHLVIIGAGGWGGVSVPRLIEQARIDPTTVHLLGRIDDPDLAVAFSLASVFAFPSKAEGFGLPILEAFSLDTPVVHSNVPALVEVAGGAGIGVDRRDDDKFVDALIEALRSVIDDDSLAADLVRRGADRARDYSWHDSATSVWQLHGASG